MPPCPEAGAGASSSADRPFGDEGPARAPARPPFPYGRIARTYAASLTLLGFERGLTRFLDRLNLEVSSGAQLLDAGCGTGLVALWTLARFPTCRALAFDRDRRMLEVASQAATGRPGLAARLRFAEGDLQSPRELRGLDGRAILLEDRTFDVVAVSGALEHVPLEPAILALRALLQPGGLLLILAVRRGWAGTLLSRVYRFQTYELGQITDALRRAGLVGIHVRHLEPRDFPANLTRVAILARRP
jgi:SAM-dependent methyltransferase